jgi:Transposase DNA-binding/Transposase DDE domain
MENNTNKSKALIWAEENFGEVQLYDKRRTKRLTNIACRLAENKGSGIARLFDGWYDTKATYNLLKLNIMTPDVIQATHRKLTIEKMLNWSGDVLAIEDSSEMEWNHHQKIDGLGPIGSGRKSDQGFILHSTLAVGVINKDNNCFFKILGLPLQQYYVRPPKRKEKQKRSHTNEPLETDLWREVIKQKAIPADSKIIRVCDRAADIYEVIQETKGYGCKHIIRLKHDRQVIEAEEDKKVKLLMQQTPSFGQTVIEKRGREGTKKRRIILQINWQQVSLRAPARPGFYAGELAPLEDNIVHLWGIDPETNELIEWFLYTDLPINSLQDAIKIAQYYACRWVVEDYHKAIKTGMKAEHLQLESAHRLFAAIAIMSVVALRLIDLREALRINPDAHALESGFDEFELKILGAYLKRELKTVRCVALAIGRLGGHQNRRSDGMPGLLTLWIGMSRFINILQGAKLNEKLNF